VTVNAREPLRVGLRLLDYPAWRVEVNGKAVTPQHAETDGEIILPLRRELSASPHGLCGLRIEPWAALFSLLSVLTLLALLNAGGLRLLFCKSLNKADTGHPGARR